MKTLAYILFFILCTLLVLSCSPKAHNCEQKAKALRKMHEKNSSQFAHYIKK